MINSKPNLIIILAIAPLFGAILQAIISNFTGVDYGHLMIVFIIVNLGLAYYDEDRLKLTGEYSSTLGSPALVPLYLYRRAKLLNHSYIYAIIWIILCIGVVLTPHDMMKELAWIITFQQ
ncbi:MAG TPA: hypothetical protein EYG73_00685 [Arcobacter sp.]|nr:hypothetical protein [Arcobacter sp.]